MIKLKNLWKVALATMAMSAMLVACDTGSTDTEKKEDDPLAKYKTNPEMAKADSFVYGFKFTTEEGWAHQFISAGKTTEKTFDKAYAKLGGEAVGIIDKETLFGTDDYDSLNDDSTKIYVDAGELVPAKLYTLTYDKKNGTVKLTDAAANAKATSTKAQEVDADGNFPAGMYISGYLGGNWAGNDNADKAILMDVVGDPTNEIYAFTWAAPAATVTVTLKITMTEDTTDDTIESTLYLRDVPVKTDGTSAIDGSIYSWNGGSAVTIKNEDGSTITGGIYDAPASASNGEWPLDEYINGNADVDIVKDFEMDGIEDLLCLSIDAKKWVPYVKGKEVTFSWTKARDAYKKAE